MIECPFCGTTDVRPDGAGKNGKRLYICENPTCLHIGFVVETGVFLRDDDKSDITEVDGNNSIAVLKSLQRLDELQNSLKNLQNKATPTKRTLRLETKHLQETENELKELKADLATRNEVNYYRKKFQFLGMFWDDGMCLMFSGLLFSITMGVALLATVVNLFVYWGSIYTNIICFLLIPFRFFWKGTHNLFYNWCENGKFWSEIFWRSLLGGIIMLIFATTILALLDIILYHTVRLKKAEKSLYYWRHSRKRTKKEKHVSDLRNRINEIEDGIRTLTNIIKSETIKCGNDVRAEIEIIEKEVGKERIRQFSEAIKNCEKTLEECRFVKIDIHGKDYSRKDIFNELIVNFDISHVKNIKESQDMFIRKIQAKQHEEQRKREMWRERKLKEAEEEAAKNHPSCEQCVYNNHQNKTCLKAKDDFKRNISCIEYVTYREKSCSDCASRIYTGFPPPLATYRCVYSHDLFDHSFKTCDKFRPIY